MYGIFANIWGILMVNVTIYGIHGSYGILQTKNQHLMLVSRVSMAVIRTKLLCLSKSEDLGSCFFGDLGSKHTYWCVLRREFSGMIQQSSHSFHVIIPASPSNPSSNPTFSTHQIRLKPIRSMSMSAWKLLGNWWDRPRETVPNHQLLNPNHIMGLWCGIKDSDCLGFRGKYALHWRYWSKVYRTSGSQQFKKWRLKTWKRLEILPLALVHGLARVFPLVMFVVFIFYKPISTTKPTYLTHLQTNLPAVIKHGNGHPPFSSLNIPLKHHDCRGFSHSHHL